MTAATTVQGHCDAKFSRVRDLLQKYTTSGAELGASVTVNIDGKDVVDIWAGYADVDRTRPWQKDTITNTFSTTKTVVALAILVLVDRGLLSVTDKVCKYWPAFAANGKQDIEIRHILSHTSGLPGFDAPLTVPDVCDAPKLAALLAEQAPWWTPGRESGYHSFTQGYLLGEIVRRVTGKSLKQFIAEEIAGPLGADFQLGCAEQDEHRRCDVVPPPPRARSATLDPTSIRGRVVTNPGMKAEFANSEAFRRAEIGAGNGHSNARGVARILSVLSRNGQVAASESARKSAGESKSESKQFLSPEIINLIFQEQYKGLDHVLDTGGRPIRWGIGFGLTGRDTWIDFLPEGRVCTWGGYGGSMVVVDLDRKLTIGYVMNRMEEVGLGSPRAREYIEAVYEALR
ncbi:beta-lactamase [Cladophialophora yegresii CBS 114405]|uniref:Beta-lactamase n=1 Tax=Cladophialophora yegresii CBS 114405 TaxID=1182544 RepID=W9W0P7_9EURO|nr:beta-lactamase [Cladophialophora yegresii CBS 114405]EXJ61657.1 beta-lactamase [Cladophialophora yegresii CBS 114405]